MAKHHAENVRIRHRYQKYLRDALGQSEASIDKAMAAIRLFEDYTQRRPFKRFHPDQAIAFKRHLAETRNARSGKALSAATIHATLTAIKSFFVWLADQPGYRSAIRYHDCAYFNTSAHDRAIATAAREQPVPTPEEIRHVLATMPTSTEIELRNRATIAYIFLTGARDGAAASTKLKHLDFQANKAYQDARDVRTKFSKTYTATFFPVGDDVRTIVEEWVNYLRREKLWGDDDPLFPATRVGVGPTRRFGALGLDRRHWSTASPIRIIFRRAFTEAELPYYKPHSFRKTLGRLMGEMCHDGEEIRAWSQNLGHDHVETTMTSYGSIDPHRQAVVMRRLWEPRPAEEDLLREIQKLVSRV